MMKRQKVECKKCGKETIIIATIPGHATTRKYSGGHVRGYNRQKIIYIKPICSECDFDNRKKLKTKKRVVDKRFRVITQKF